MYGKCIRWTLREGARKVHANSSAAQPEGLDDLFTVTTTAPTSELFRVQGLAELEHHK